MTISNGLSGLNGLVRWATSPVNAFNSGTFLSENISRMFDNNPFNRDLPCKGHIDYSHIYLHLLDRIKAGQDVCLTNLFKSREVGLLCWGMLIEKRAVNLESAYKVDLLDPAGPLNPVGGLVASVPLFAYVKLYNEETRYLHIFHKDYDHSISISTMSPLKDIELTETKDKITIQSVMLQTLFSTLLSSLTRVNKEVHLVKTSIMPPLQYVDPCKVLILLHDALSGLKGEARLQFSSLEDAFTGFRNPTIEDTSSTDIITNALQNIVSSPGILHMVDGKFCLPLQNDMLFTEARTKVLCGYEYNPVARRKQRCSVYCVCKFPSMTLDARKSCVGMGIAFTIFSLFDTDAVVPDHLKTTVKMTVELYDRMSAMTPKSAQNFNYVNQLTYKQLAKILLDWTKNYNLPLLDKFLNYVATDFNAWFQLVALQELRIIAPDVHDKIIASDDTWPLLQNLSNNYVKSCAYSYMNPLLAIGDGKKIYKGYVDKVLEVKMAKWAM